MINFKRKNDFFKANLLDKVIQRQFRENEFSTELYNTKLDNCCLLFSKIVAEVVFIRALSEKEQLLKGDVLCILKYLGSKYYVLMEENGYIQKVYITENQIIDYSHPLFLFKITI